MRINLFAEGVAAGYRATLLPFRVHYIRLGGNLSGPSAAFGWVRGTGGVLPLQ